MIRLPWVRRRVYDRMVGRAAATISRHKAEHAAAITTITRLRRQHRAEIEALCAAHTRQLDAARAQLPPTVADLLRQVNDLEVRLAVAEHATHAAAGAGAPAPAGVR